MCVTAFVEAVVVIDFFRKMPPPELRLVTSSRREPDCRFDEPNGLAEREMLSIIGMRLRRRKGNIMGMLVVMMATKDSRYAQFPDCEAPFMGS